MNLSFLKLALKNKIFWYLASRYVTFASQFITSIYIAVKLGAYYFGIWSFFLLLVNIGTQVNWGIGNAINILLVQHREDDVKCKSYILNSLVLTGIISLPPLIFLFIDRIFGIRILEKYHLGNLIYAVVAVIILTYATGLFNNIFRVKNRILEIAVNQSLPTLLLFIIMFFASGERLLILMAGGYVAAYIISGLCYVKSGVVDWKSSIQKRILKEIFMKGIFLFLYNAGFMFILLSSKFLISRYYSVEEFGYFSFAFSMAWAALLLIDSFSFLIFPKMIDLLKGDNRKEILQKIESMHQMYVTCVHGIFYLAIPACWILLQFIPKYQPAFPAFVVIALTIMVYTQCFGYSTYMLAQNKERIMALLVSGTIVLNIGAMLFFIHACSVSFAVAMFGTMLAYTIYTVSVGMYARILLKEISTLKNIFAIFHPAKIFPCLFAILLLLMNNRHILWIPLAVYLLFNMRDIKHLIGGMIKVVRNQNIIDLRIRGGIS